MRRASQVARIVPTPKIKEKFLQRPKSYGLCSVGNNQKKTKYANHKDAQSQIEIIKIKDPRLAMQLHTYKCPTCGYIHLSHKDQQPYYTGVRRRRLNQLTSLWRLEYVPVRNRVINGFAKIIIRLLFKDLAEALDRAVVEREKEESNT